MTMPILDLPYGPGAPPLTDAGEAAQRRIDQVVQAIQVEAVKLIRPDGSPVYAEREQAEREAAVLATFERDLASVREAAERDEAAARATIVALDGADPTDTLTDAE